MNLKFSKRCLKFTPTRAKSENRPAKSAECRQKRQQLWHGSHQMTVLYVTLINVIHILLISTEVYHHLDIMKGVNLDRDSRSSLGKCTF